MATPNESSGSSSVHTVHKFDVAGLILVILGVLAEMSDVLPSKYSGIVLALFAVARLGTKFGVGSSAQLNEGQELGNELKSDIKLVEAKKPLDTSRPTT